MSKSCKNTSLKDGLFHFEEVKMDPSKTDLRVKNYPI